MQSPQVAGTGVLHTDGAPVDDGLDIAAVDEILSQHSCHTPAVKSSTDVQQSAPTSVHQPHRASWATTTPASIANNNVAMAIDLTDEQPKKPAAKPQGTLVSDSYTSNQVNTAGATVDRQHTGQLASTSDRYTCSPVLGLGDCAEQCVIPDTSMACLLSKMLVIKRLRMLTIPHTPACSYLQHNRHKADFSCHNVIVNYSRGVDVRPLFLGTSSCAGICRPTPAQPGIRNFLTQGPQSTAIAVPTSDVSGLPPCPHTCLYILLYQLIQLLQHRLS